MKIGHEIKELANQFGSQEDPEEISSIVGDDRFIHIKLVGSAFKHCINSKSR